MQYPHLARKQLRRRRRKSRGRERLARRPQLQTFLQLLDFLIGKIAPHHNTEQSFAELLRLQVQQSAAHFVDHFRADFGFTYDLQMNRIPPARNCGSDPALLTPNTEPVLRERKSKASRLELDCG